VTQDLEGIAASLIQELGKHGVHADRFTTGPGVAGINVWGATGRYPLTSVTISSNNRFKDIAWGENFDHVVPLATPPGDVAAAIAAWLEARGDEPRRGAP
jgi:hypothetical protein